MTKAEYIASLDQFALGYLECALWSSTDESRDDGGDPLDSNYDFHDIARASLESLVADCVTFQRVAADLLTQAYGRDYSEARAGHDFWLTRNGHGAGFWDRDELETVDGESESLGDRLSALCGHGTAFAEVNLSVYRGRIYADGCGDARPALPVIFRADRSGDHKGTVTAVFPTLPGTSDPWTATCYAHVGQHGTCGRDWYATTRAATPAEYADLLNELRGIYERDDRDAVRLDVVNRWTRHHDAARRAELQRQRESV